MKFNYLLLGSILKNRRIEKGFSKNKLAQHIGISQPEVTRIENGIRTVPNLITLINMCEILDIDFINLLKVTGYVDSKNLLKKGLNEMKKYKVQVKKIKQLEVEVEAENEEIAMEMAQDFLDKIDELDTEIPDLTTDYFEIEAEEIDEEQENIDDDLEDIFEEDNCQNCKFFCSECGRCTLEH